MADCEEIQTAVPAFPTALEQLQQDLTELSSLLTSINVELPQLVRLAAELTSAGYELRFSNALIAAISRTEVAPSVSISQSLFMVKYLYPVFVKRVTRTVKLRESIQSTMGELPAAILDKLPIKDGTTWRSYYFRECLDVLHQWPPKVQREFTSLGLEINAADLMRVARPRDLRQALPLRQRFEGFIDVLEEGLSDIHSLRFEFASSASIVTQETAITADSDSKRDSGAETCSAADKSRGKYKITPDTLRVFRMLEKPIPDNKIYEQYKKDTGRPLSTDHLRQIRSRFNNSRYEL